MQSESGDRKMDIKIREYAKTDIDAVMKIWNQVVEEGVAFPQEEPLTEDNADAFFSQQTYTGVAEDRASEDIVGMYILHPNNVGRCGHICNASYAVRKDIRGGHIGEKLVKDCMSKAHENGYRILQFNAVVAGNTHAIHLYERLGFQRIGVVPEGFHMPDGSYEDIILFYHTL
jgi:L-amino acid N-acyltransferase YncA